MKRSTKNKHIQKGKPGRIVFSPISFPTKILRAMRRVDHGTVTLSNAATVSGGKNFLLSDVPNSSEYTAMYDVYRIMFVRFKFMFNANMIQVQSASPFNAVRWASVIDYNSSQALASLNDARDIGTCVISVWPDIKNPKVREIVPRYVGVAEDSSSSVVAASNATGWLNTSANNIPHYGIRYFFEQLTSPYTGSVDLEAEYYLEFQRTK